MANPRIKNYLIVLLAVAAAAVGALAWSEYRELIRLRAASLSDSARADLQKRLWDLEKRKNELEAEVAQLRARGGPAAAAAEQDDALAADDARGPARPPPGRFNRRAGFSNLSTLLENPEFNRLWTTQQKALLDGRYAALFKNLNLSPADLDKFKGLLVDKQNAMMDVMAAARDQGLNPRNPDDRAQIASLEQTAQAQVDANIRQALGDTQFAQYQNYEQTLPQRNVVNQLAQTLSYTGAPLQPYQVDQLVNILAANAPARSQGSGGWMGMVGPMGAGALFTARDAPITDTAVTQAQSVLTSPQLAALQQLQTQQQAQRQIGQMMRQVFGGGAQSQPAGGNGPTATPVPSRPSGG
ncbi:MAG TPA: hypothetical protein VLT83_01855 [Opitutaceae bacterium]|nr:hypothetical protein [Opitutaceae bacterium]